MPMPPHISPAVFEIMPLWLKAITIACLIGYAVIMLAGAYALWHRCD